MGPAVDSESLAAFVRQEIADYRYEPPSSPTIGVPWPAEKVQRYVERLAQSLVKPYLARFELRDTFEQTVREPAEYGEYWVVAEGRGGYVEYYDPGRKEFGLAVRSEVGPPVSIGVRGDLVGVYCAI